MDFNLNEPLGNGHMAEEAMIAAEVGICDVTTQVAGGGPKSTVGKGEGLYNFEIDIRLELLTQDPLLPDPCLSDPCGPSCDPIATREITNPGLEPVLVPLNVEREGECSLLDAENGGFAEVSCAINAKVNPKKPKKGALMMGAARSMNLKEIASHGNKHDAKCKKKKGKSPKVSKGASVVVKSQSTVSEVQVFFFMMKVRWFRKLQSH